MHSTAWVSQGNNGGGTVIVSGMPEGAYVLSDFVEQTESHRKDALHEAGRRGIA